MNTVQGEAKICDNTWRNKMKRNKFVDRYKGSMKYELYALGKTKVWSCMDITQSKNETTLQSETKVYSVQMAIQRKTKVFNYTAATDIHNHSRRTHVKRPHKPKANENRRFPNSTSYK